MYNSNPNFIHTVLLDVSAFVVYPLCWGNRLFGDTHILVDVFVAAEQKLQRRSSLSFLLRMSLKNIHSQS